MFNLDTALSGLAIDSLGNVYYGGFGDPNGLRLIDQTTGAVLLDIPYVPVDEQVGLGLAFDENDLLYGIRKVGSD